MTDDKTPEARNPAPGRTSAERRRLLKAAAAAPLVATVHTGAARANASASQCVIDSKAESDGGGSVPRQFRPDSDLWVRRNGQLARARSNLFVGDGRPAQFLVFKADTSTQWYTDWGQAVTPTFGTPCDVNTQVCAGTPQPTKLLEIYRQDIVGGVTKSVHTVGYFPIDALQYYRDTAPSENMAITASCLCSVDPALDPNA
jgi:hypothetical protein